MIKINGNYQIPLNIKINEGGKTYKGSLRDCGFIISNINKDDRKAVDNETGKNQQKYKR